MRWLFVLMFLLTGLATAQEDVPSETPASAEAPEAADAPEATETPTVAQEGGVKTLSGMSILGNEEAPKSLVIVPWKSSRIGDGIGVTNSLDERARPVDKEVFMRELHYYELRSGSTD
jgi:hypothetical protein